MSSTETFHASCLCRAVQWEARGPLFNMSHCHCGMCRKAHGSPFSTYVGAKADGFRFTQGQDKIMRYRSSENVERSFCSECGSVVPSGKANGGSAYMSVGNFDEDPQIKPGAHIFAASKAAWYAITDDLPQHDEYPAQWSMPSVQALRAEGVAPLAVNASPDGSATGSCLCGRVAYAVAPGPWSFFNCHCTRCRKARSAAHTTNVFVDVARFSWLRGESELKRFKLPEAIRFTQAFCQHCGGKLPVVRTDRVAIPAASLDTAITPTDTRHIFVASKAPWFEISDTAPQFPEYPPG